MTQIELAHELGIDRDTLRGYIGAMRQRKTKTLHIKAWRRDEDGGRLYIRALYAAGPGRDATKPPPLSKSQYNARAKRKMRTRVASVFHLGSVNKINSEKIKLLSKER